MCKIHNGATVDPDECLRVKSAAHLSQGDMNQILFAADMHCRVVIIRRQPDDVGYMDGLKLSEMSDEEVLQRSAV